MQKKIFLIRLMFFTCLMWLSVQTAFAATTTPKPSPSPTPSPSVTPTPSDQQTTDELKKRIDNVIKNRGDEVKGLINEITLKKRGFIGSVERVTNSTITIQNEKGSQTLTINSDVILIKDNKKASIDDVTIGDEAIVLGYVDKQEFILKRIMLSSSSFLPKTYDTTVGTLQNASKTQLSLVPRDPDTTTPNPIVFSIDKNTQFQDNHGQPIKKDQLQIDSSYVVISYTAAPPTSSANSTTSGITPSPSPTSSKIVTIIRALGEVTPSPSPSTKPSKGTSSPSPSPTAK